MANTKKFLKIIRYFLIILLLFNLSRTYYDLKVPFGAFFILCMLTITNDIIRSVIINNTYNSMCYHFSLVLSIIGAAVLKHFANGLVPDIYMFFYIIEILYVQGKSKQYLLTLHGTFYLITVILNTRALNTPERLTVLGTNILTYLVVFYMLYLSHAVRNEREETKKLNEELKLSNIKLQEYSLKVEELSIAKERERVAQELHDSLGHSLMALIMHLEFAEKIFDINPNKAKEVILKAKLISKDSTSSLRTAVSALNEERTIEDLRNAINELIGSFQMLGNVKINFCMDKHLETLNPEIKLCIYKTIRESLTNGIKHGKATIFNLKLGIQENCVKLNIKNNGIGSGTIIKSNGLIGIENRISALGGIVVFKSQENCGFLIEAKIPLYEEIE